MPDAGPAPVRIALEEDLRSLEDIERAAGRPFAGIGMGPVADDDPFTLDELRAYTDDGRCWVAVAHSDEVVGYAVADLVDGCGHVEQVSVDPVARGRRIGAALIGQVGAWAAGSGLEALTLTTFVEVPWNGPYYERLGFRWLADDEIGPGLAALRADEAAHGLDRWPRGCMRRELD